MPSAAGDRYYMFPLSGAPAQRICRLMGWETGGDPAYWTLTEHFYTMNALERHQPWSVRKARANWSAHLLNDWEPDQHVVVVCLGRRAAAAVGLNADRAPGDWLEVGLLHAVMIPHTSGRNREWNDPATGVLVRNVLTEALEKASKLL